MNVTLKAHQIPNASQYPCVSCHAQRVVHGSAGLHLVLISHLQVSTPEELWRNSHGRQGRGVGGQADSDSAGQVCASILVKLMIDMYLKAGPAVAYPLALLMLQR